VVEFRHSKRHSVRMNGSGPHEALAAVALRRSSRASLLAEHVRGPETIGFPTIGRSRVGPVDADPAWCTDDLEQMIFNLHRAAPPAGRDRTRDARLCRMVTALPEWGSSAWRGRPAKADESISHFQS
jgi:hypothetical protein